MFLLLTSCDKHTYCFIYILSKYFINKVDENIYSTMINLIIKANDLDCCFQTINFINR